MTSPTQRTLSLLREQGWSVAITEHWNSFTRRRQDMFGFVDLLAVREDEKPLLLQVTSGANTSARRTKILGIPEAKVCLQADMRIVVVGWRKLKVKRGGKAMRWAPKWEEIYISDFDTDPSPDAVDDKKNPTV